VTRRFWQWLIGFDQRKAVRFAADGRLKITHRNGLNKKVFRSVWRDPVPGRLRVIMLGGAPVAKKK